MDKKLRRNVLWKLNLKCCFNETLGQTFQITTFHLYDSWFVKFLILTLQPFQK